MVRSQQYSIAIISSCNIKEPYVDEFLNLCWCQHPTNVKDDFNVGNSSFLQLKKLRCLLQVFKLKGSFRHLMALTPFFNSSDIIIDLETTFPREEVSSTC